MLMRKLIAAVVAVALAVAAMGCGPKCCEKCGSAEKCDACAAAAKDAPAEK
jgi:hypothetical protein